MAKSNKARELLWPANEDILVRVVFLYVGQGSSTIVLVADGDSYTSLLIDINVDTANGGIDVAQLMSDLVGEQGLEAFVNTHPHDDHLRGLAELSKEVSIGQVWHSDHKPSTKHGSCHEDLRKLIKKVNDSGGTEKILKGSKDEQTIGDAHYYVLAPAEYLTDEINEERAEERYQQIHEQCSVVKFGIAETWIMIPSDAGRDAFEKHIAQYPKDRLGAVVLCASHHGSRTFFRHGEDDDPYTEALEAIDPDYVVISAPKRSESRHGHPHEDAVQLYADQVGEGNVLHTGEKRYCYICDIFRDGTYSGIDDDRGVLAETYPAGGGDDDGKDGGKHEAATALAPIVVTRVDDRPMGAR